MEDDYAKINEYFANDAFESQPVGEKGVSDQVNNLLEKENDQVKKKVARTRRQPKLDEMTLMGPKGIEALRDSFKSFKPDPKKDPYDNLDVMLKKYEHWAHCMFPKLKFEDVVNRCEQLGEKRAVKVYMTKFRLGMPLTDEDFASIRHRKGDEAEVFATSTLSVTTSSKAHFSSDVLDDMMESAIEARKIALEDERNRKEEEAFAMVGEIMADFDMY
ncbi:unnamed protein product [Angiostrongylus costaricensis]|uniref:TIMELESS-interacting protein n=1 Tax=Angiostrongylus costaricensis TaxID=334426 RepID=A0A0R3PVB1_ANGCS|nr:unnamed protein product [Angiostrongylus costaricensis]